MNKTIFISDFFIEEADEWRGCMVDDKETE